MSSRYIQVSSKKQALIYLEQWLEMQNVHPKIITVFVNLTSLCINQCYFSFEGNIYEQLDGVTMGNPISSFIADLLMGFKENEMKSRDCFPEFVSGMWMTFLCYQQ